MQRTQKTKLYMEFIYTAWAAFASLETESVCVCVFRGKKREELQVSGKIRSQQ